MDAIQKVKVREEDFGPVLLKIEALKDTINFDPVLQRINTLKLDEGFLTPVLNMIESMKASILAQTSANFGTVLELIDKSKVRDDHFRPVLSVIDSIKDTINFAPVLHRIDSLKVDSEFCLPVLNKIDAMQVAVLAQTRRELKPVLENLQSAIEKTKVREADLGSVLRRLNTFVAPVDVAPVLECIRSLKADPDFFSPVLHRMDTVQAKIIEQSTNMRPALEAIQNTLKSNPDSNLVLDRIDALQRNTDLTPLLQCINAVKATLDSEFLSPVFDKIDALQVAEIRTEMKVQMRAETTRVLDTVLSSINKVEARQQDLSGALETKDATQSKIDFGPVLQHIDNLKMDSALLSEITKKIEALRSASVSGQGAAEQRSEDIRKKVNAILKKVDEMQASRDASPSQVKAEQKIVLEAVEKIKLLEAGLNPAIQRIESLVGHLN